MSEPGPTSFAEPVRVLSDLHLGHPASLIDQVRSLRPLFEGAGTVIFNGDTCEQCYSAWREDGEAKRRVLESLCADAGARCVFLTGNHDPAIADTGWLELADGKLLVTHGHAVYRSVAPWSHEYLDKKAEIRRFLEERHENESSLAHRWETTRMLTRLLMPERATARRFGGQSYLLSALWPPERCFHILRVWLGMAGAADRFMAQFRPAARVLLFGHFHRAGVWKRNGRLLCNTGAFMQGSRPLMAELRDGRLSVFNVVHESGAFRGGDMRAEVRLWE